MFINVIKFATENYGKVDDSDAFTRSTLSPCTQVSASTNPSLAQHAWAREGRKQAYDQDPLITPLSRVLSGSGMKVGPNLGTRSHQSGPHVF